MASRFALALIVTLALPWLAAASPDRTADRSFASVPAYDMDVRVVPDARRIEVEGTVRIAAGDKPVDTLPLALHRSMRDLRVEVLEPAVSAGPARLELKARQSWADIWFVSPPTPVPAGAALTLRFSYSGGEEGGFTFSLGPEGSFAHGSNAAWYPEVDANGYVGHVGTLRFSAPPPYVVAASGEARSSLAEMARGAFRFEVRRPAIFAFGAGRYTVAKRLDRGAPIVSAYLLRPRAGVDAYLASTARILGVLAGHFGPYPLGELTIVEIPAEKAKGFFMASSSGLVFVPGTFLDRPVDVVNVAHEIAHQWWGNLVGMEGGKQATLFTEGLAQLGGLLALEAIEGPAAADRMRRSGVASASGAYSFNSCLGYDVPMQSTHGYLMLAASGSDMPLVALDGELSHALATSKGTLVFDLLSRTVGRARFDAALAEIARRHAFRFVGWAELLGTVEARSGTSLRWFYEQWFERPGAPDWRVTWRQEGGELRGEVTQSEPYFRAAVELRADGDGGRQAARTVEVGGPRTEFVLPVDFPARRVEIDPRFLVPHWTPEYRAEADAMRLCASGSADEDSAQVEQAYVRALAAPETQADPLRRFMLEYGLAQVYVARRDHEAAVRHLRLALGGPERPSDVLPWAYYYLAKISGEIGDDAAMRSASADALAADRAAGGVPSLAGKVRALAGER